MIQPIQVAAPSQGSSSSVLPNSSEIEIFPTNLSLQYTIDITLSTQATTLQAVVPPIQTMFPGHDSYTLECTILPSAQGPHFAFSNSTQSISYDLAAGNIVSIPLEYTNTNQYISGTYTLSMQCISVGITNGVPSAYGAVVIKNIPFQILQNPQLTVSPQFSLASVLLGTSGSTPFLYSIDCDSNWSVISPDPDLEFSATSGVAGSSSLFVAVKDTVTHATEGIKPYSFQIQSGTISHTINMMLQVSAAAPEIEPLNIYQLVGQAPKIVSVNVATTNAAYTITPPTFLSLLGNTVENSNGTIYFEVVSSYLQTEGQYGLTIEINGNDEILYIPVTLFVTNLVDISDFDTGAFHYTREDKRILVNKTAQSNTRVQIEGTVLYGDYAGNIFEDTVNIEREFLQDQCSILPGRILEAYFPEIEGYPEEEEVSFLHYSHLRPVIVDFTVKEISTQTQTTLLEIQLPSMAFFLGERRDEPCNTLVQYVYPGAKVNTHALLDENTAYQWQQDGSTLYSSSISVYSSPQIYALSMRIPEDTEEMSVFLLKIQNKLERMFVVLPSVDTQVDIQYINKNGCVEYLHARGALSVQDTFSYSTVKKGLETPRFISNKGEDNPILSLSTGLLPTIHIGEKVRDVFQNKEVWISIKGQRILAAPREMSVLSFDSGKESTNYKMQFLLTKNKYNAIDIS